MKYRSLLLGVVLLEQLHIGPYQNFSYLVADRDGGEGFVIDPSFEPTDLLDAIDRHNVRVRFILNTHRHPDHTAGNARVKEHTGAKVVAHRAAPIAQDISVEDGSSLDVGTLHIEVIGTPGHTPDSVFYRFDPYVATGDTLFVGECGRTDLPGGDTAQMFDTLIHKVRALPDDLVVLPGHDYGPTPTSTIGDEKRDNYTLEVRTLDEFLRFMEQE